MINKCNMLSEFKHATRHAMSNYRKDFTRTFLKTRQTMIRNDIGKDFKNKKMEKERIQTRLNDKILIFKKSVEELPRKT